MADDYRAQQRERERVDRERVHGGMRATTRAGQIEEFKLNRAWTPPPAPQTLWLPPPPIVVDPPLFPAREQPWPTVQDPPLVRGFAQPAGRYQPMPVSPSAGPGNAIMVGAIVFGLFAVIVMLAGRASPHDVIETTAILAGCGAALAAALWGAWQAAVIVWHALPALGRSLLDLLKGAAILVAIAGGAVLAIEIFSRL